MYSWKFIHAHYKYDLVVFLELFVFWASLILQHTYLIGNKKWIWWTSLNFLWVVMVIFYINAQKFYNVFWFPKTSKLRVADSSFSVPKQRRVCKQYSLDWWTHKKMAKSKELNVDLTRNFLKRLWTFDLVNWSIAALLGRKYLKKKSCDFQLWRNWFGWSEMTWNPPSLAWTGSCWNISVTIKQLLGRILEYNLNPSAWLFKRLDT